MKTDETLRKETEKWLSRIEKERKKVSVVSEMPQIKKVMKNMDAYISDTMHFLGKGDLVRAFEAVVYAWGMLETLEHAGLVKRSA